MEREIEACDLRVHETQVAGEARLATERAAVAERDNRLNAADEEKAALRQQVRALNRFMYTDSSFVHLLRLHSPVFRCSLPEEMPPKQ